MQINYWKLAMIAVLATLLIGGCNQSSAHGNQGMDNHQSPEGASCQIDGDCQSYFRCIDSVCSEPPAMSGEHSEDTPVARFYGPRNQLIAEFYLELAISDQQQRRGLMHRPEMLDDWGMLFVYDTDQYLSFWMKNTLISLDMIFVDSSGEVVGVVEEAEPETETPRGVDRPSRFVLEVNAGLAGEHGIERGTQMRLENVEDGHRPQR